MGTKAEHEAEARRARLRRIHDQFEAVQDFGRYIRFSIDIGKGRSKERLKRLEREVLDVEHALVDVRDALRFLLADLKDQGARHGGKVER